MVRKILIGISIFLLMLCSTCFSQEQALIEYRFNSTSLYINSQRGGEYVCYDNYGIDNPVHRNGPRRVIADDDDEYRPGYQPSDPAMPIGDLTIVDFIVFIGMAIIIIKIKQRKEQKI